MTLLDRALTRLRTEQERAGKAREFAVLSPFLTAERGAIPYAEAAAQLGVSEAAARQAVHRVRKRFREVFREEITQTVAAPGGGGRGNPSFTGCLERISSARATVTIVAVSLRTG